MSYLHGFLPVVTAIDVGANRGDISLQLLAVGYTVYAFEPYPPLFEELQKRLGSRAGCSVYDLALGTADTSMKLHIAEDMSANRGYGDVSVLNSLVLHSMPSDLRFVRSVDVAVRSLGSLASEGKIPSDIGLLKVDTEGYDLAVLQGMDDLRPHVVFAEFWASDFVFGRQGASNQLEQLVKEMRARGYNWHLVLYRLSGSDQVSFYCNDEHSVSDSWGNVCFFRDHQLFMHAHEWCSAVLPPTHLNYEDSSGPRHIAHNRMIFPELEARLDKLREQLVRREQEIAEMSGKARELEELLRAREQESKQLESQLNRTRSELRAELRERSDLDNRVRELSAALEVSQRAAEASQDRIRRMRHSVSWKLTSPFREMRRAGTRIRRALGLTRDT